MTSANPDNLYKKVRQAIAFMMVCLLGASSVIAGITITPTNGITSTGADGIQYVGTSGITATGADGILAFGPNGITATGADGITATGADGITATGADGYTYAGANGITATGADGLSIAKANGITATGADGITATGADGSTYQLDSIAITSPNGITATGADGITATGADGITATGADSRSIVRTDGVTVKSPATVAISSADGITATGADGQTISISSNSVTLTGVDLLVVSGSQNVQVSGARGIVETGVNALTSSLVGSPIQSGLQSVDPELAVLLNRFTDDSNVDAVIIYHHLPGEADLADLQRIGVFGGTRYRMLPMIALTASKAQIAAISHLSSVRSIYGNRTFQWNLEPAARTLTGVERVRRNADLTRANRGLPVSGRGVTVAVLDTGVDGTHSDLAGHVVQNIKLADTQSLGAGFNYPISAPSLPNTDQAYGHGTFVAGVIAGSGQQSGGKYAGVAPSAQILGLSAGDASLLFVLSGFDYLLTNGASFGVRVVNCSFSANTVFDINDPVNIATRMLTDNGVSVVFSAGNTGPGLDSLNPYSIAPWVISTGATDDQGRLASFSSRGDFGSSLFHPTLVAPGSNTISLRATNATVTGANGLAGNDAQQLTTAELPYYATASGTSFSAPQVAGVIALMLEANPQLTPAQIRDILQRTATPLPPYYSYEVGAGMLNAQAAVLEAAFPERHFGGWRGVAYRDQVQFVNNAPQVFNGTTTPGSSSDSTLTIPADMLIASVQIAWGSLLSSNNLSLALLDSQGVQRATANSNNQPGLTGHRQRTVVSMPAAGAWKARVTASLGSAGATAQPYTGVLQVTSARYPSLTDISALDGASIGEIYQSFRSLVMCPIGQHFRPDFAVTRGDLATALVLGARVPQYLPAQSGYPDVRDRTTMLLVESVQGSPNGALFIDVTPGGAFRPNDPVNRLAATIALVRAAGFRAEAESKAGAPLTFTDALSIPSNLRGYVAVAIARGLISADTAFRPQSPLTRIELAHAMAAVSRLATQ